VATIGAGFLHHWNVGRCDGRTLISALKFFILLACARQTAEK
jgi:hypothetical protein